MKNLILLISASVWLTTMTYAQTPQDSSINKEFNDLKIRIDQNEKDFDNSTTQKLVDLNQIKSEISKLITKENLTNEEIKKLTVLHIKRTILEDELIFQTRDNAVTILEQRYETGGEILQNVLVQLLNLQSKYHDIKLYQSYSNMSNPMQYSEFIGNLDEIQKKLSRKKFDITLPAPLTDVINKNPSIATGYSLVTTILSTMDVKDKSQKFNTIRDVLTLTSSMQGDLNLLNSEINYLDSRVSSFLLKSEKFFAEYTSVITYTKTYDEFINLNDKQTLALLQISTFKTVYTNISENKTNSLFMMSQTNKEVEITFNLMRLVDLINEYKSVLDETLNYYDKFQSVLNKYNSSDFPELNVNAKMLDGKTFKETLTKITTELGSAKDAAIKAYKASDVSDYEIRKILYGKPTQ